MSPFIIHTNLKKGVRVNEPYIIILITIWVQCNWLVVLILLHIYPTPFIWATVEHTLF